MVFPASLIMAKKNVSTLLGQEHKKKEKATKKLKVKAQLE